MKKIITPAVPEEYKMICDVTGQPPVARLALRFDYYGGVHDCKVLQVDLCEEAAVEVLNLLQSKYPQFQTKEGDVANPCPMCERGFFGGR